MYEIGCIRVCINCERDYQHYGQKLSRCRPCRREYDRKYHANRSDSEKLRKVNLQTQRYRKNLQWVRDVKAEKACVDCGIADYRVLQFDHLPQYEKVISITDALRRGYSQKKIMDEMAKCEVVCANCQSIRTFERGDVKASS